MLPVTGSGRVVAGRYKLLDPVGHGAMGTVWRARDLRLDRVVAVKEVRVPGPLTHQDRSILRERSLREARVAARLSHPGVVTVHDVIEDEGSPWIIMELVSSRSLAQVLAEDGPMSPSCAAAMGMTLLEALGSAHAAGVVHRDVKPGNILVTPEGRVVLTDFGIATLDGDPGLTQAGMVMGTPGFCAPERIRGEPASPASDLWSLGATLYASVEGRNPFEGQGSAMAVLANIVHGDPPPAKSAGPLGPLITALMKRDPAARPDADAARRLLAAACVSPPAGDAAVAGIAGAPDEAVEQDEAVERDEARAPVGAGGSAGAGAQSDARPQEGAGASHEAGTPNGTQARADAGVHSGAGAGPVRPAGAGGCPEQTGSRGGTAGPRSTLALTVPPQFGRPAPAAIPAPGGQHGKGGRRRSGRRRRALVFGGGGAAVVLAALVVVAGIAHAARLAQVKRTAASSPIAATAALPAGYHWYTARASGSPRRAGFSIPVADGWRTRQRGDTTLIRNPATGAVITITRPGPGGPGPLRQAQLLADGPHASFPGYHRIALLPAPFRGTLAGAWRFAYVRPGTGTEQVLELVTRLGTPLGAQPFELTVTSPQGAWPASRAAFGVAVAGFTPRS